MEHLFCFFVARQSHKEEAQIVKNSRHRRVRRIVFEDRQGFPEMSFRPAHFAQA
jgi:hypothetical protein